MKTEKLPNKPSELILIALHDLREVEKLPKSAKTSINMDSFYIETNGICQVCLAGAVMKQRLLTPVIIKEFIEEQNDDLECNSYRIEVDPSELNKKLNDSSIGQKAYAIDMFRLGQIENGLRELDIYVEDYPYLVDYVEITPYEDDEQQFYKDMEELATNLKHNGL